VIANQLQPARNPTYERWRWQVFSITWIAYAGFYLTRKSFAVAKIEMGKPETLGLSQAEMAWIDGGFLVAYAIGQFSWGILGDRFGTRRIILLGMLGSIGAALAMGFAQPAWLPTGVESALAILASPVGVSVVTLLLAGWYFLQGIFQSSGWAPLAKNIANFFSHRERGVIMGLWCTNYAAGGLIASTFAGLVADRFGWRAAFIAPALVLFLIWTLFLVLQRDRPEDVGLAPIEVYHGELPKAPAAESKDPRGIPPAEGRWQVVREVAGHPMVLLLCLVYFCLKPARYAILFWGPKYVHDRLGTDTLSSGLIGGLFELAGPISVLVAGIVSDRIFGARRMPVCVLCLFLLAAMLFVLNRLPANGTVLGISLFVIGFLVYAPDSMVAGTAALDFGTKRGASTASGLINGWGSVGAILGGTLPGFFQERGGWHGVFTVLAIAVLVAALVLLPKWNALPDEASRIRPRLRRG